MPHRRPLCEAWPVSTELPFPDPLLQVNAVLLRPWNKTELPFPDPLLQVNAVLLRPWNKTDVPSIVTACQDPTISRWSPAIPYPYSEDDALGWLEQQEPARLAGASLDLAVVHATSDEVLGAIGLGSVN